MKKCYICGRPVKNYIEIDSKALGNCCYRKWQRIRKTRFTVGNNEKHKCDVCGKITLINKDICKMSLCCLCCLHSNVRRKCYRGYK